jgi:hypothetical protein
MIAEGIIGGIPLGVMGWRPHHHPFGGIISYIMGFEI